MLSQPDNRYCTKCHASGYIEPNVLCCYCLGSGRCSNCSSIRLVYDELTNEVVCKNCGFTTAYIGG